MSIDQFYKSFHNLKKYCESEKFKGYDPYDGLNSKIFNKISILNNNKYFRLCWIQFFKKSPVNFRKWALILPDYNPKAMGLFLSAYCKLYQLSSDKQNLEKINFFIDKILSLKSQQNSHSSWGYNFNWQSRAFYHPAFTPNIVTSSFVANALLDWYDIKGESKMLSEARSTCDFILKDLHRSVDDTGNIAFSYSSLDQSVVFNASLLGARLLARVFAITREIELYETAKSVVQFCCNNQKKSGGWNYGILPFHQWEDSFHTGYMLECLSDYMKYTNDYSFVVNLSKGFNYYIKTYFTNKGLPAYYSNSLYPVDIHSISQLIITLYKLDKLDQYKILVDKTMNWTIHHMQSKSGFFYYQKKKYFTIKIPYMRWSQAWMFLSMSIYLFHLNKTEKRYSLVTDSALDYYKN